MGRSLQRSLWAKLAAGAAIPLVGVTACDAVLGLDDIQLATCVPGVPGHCDGQTCVDGVCVGDCAQGSKRCAGTTPEVCDANGEWVGGASCGAGTECSAGACVVLCVPGDLKCFGDQPNLCDASGQWDENGDACPPCLGCDESTGACAISPKPDGAPCDDGNACTLTAECQSAQCVATSEVSCAAAGPCSPGTCDPSTGECAAADGTACDDGRCATVVDTCQGGVCNPGADHAWAHWDSKTAKSYVITDDVVVDPSTGLTWQRAVPEGEHTWQAARDHCSSLSLPGYASGWRLPTRIELVSIVDYTAVGPATDTNAFVGTPSDIFWSSSPLASTFGEAWGVDFYAGNVEASEMSEGHRYRCVR